MFNLSVKCFFIDEPLSSGEVTEVEGLITPCDDDDGNGGVRIEQVRVPFVLPVPEQGGGYQKSPGELIESARGNLRKAGIEAESGCQVIWLAPEDIIWASLFQTAIYNETGFFPISVHRWRVEDGAIVKKGLIIKDGMHGEQLSRD